MVVSSVPAYVMNVTYLNSAFTDQFCFLVKKYEYNTAALSIDSFICKKCFMCLLKIMMKIKINCKSMFLITELLKFLSK